MSSLNTLVHHSPGKTLWIDLDASNNFSFGAIIFYTATDNYLSSGGQIAWQRLGAANFIPFQATGIVRLSYVEIAGFI